MEFRDSWANCAVTCACILTPPLSTCVGCSVGAPVPTYTPVLGVMAWGFIRPLDKEKSFPELHRSFPVAAARPWNTFGTRLLLPSSAENWRPFYSGRRYLMRSDNVPCFIWAPVAQCWSVSMYWLLQTDFIDIVLWSCSSNAIMPPK